MSKRIGRPLVLLALLALSIPALPLAGQEPGESQVYFEVEQINPTLEGLAGDANLETPQACVEHFMLASRGGDWRRAAAALDFRLLGEIDGRRAALLAERFFFVLQQELWIDWRRLPDRSDGLETGSSLGRPDPMDGRARRSIEIGEIEVDGRPLPVSVERLKPASGEPRWMFSAQTVENIDALWEAHGPSWLASQMPSWARERWHLRVPVWQWIGFLLLLLGAPFLGYLCSALIRRWIVKRYSGPGAELCARVQWPAGATIAALFAWTLMELVLGLPSEVAAVAEPLAMILFVSMVVWLAMRVTSFLIERVLGSRIRHLHEEETNRRKQLLTQVAVARHVVLLLLVLIGIAIVLLQLDVFHTLGVTLLTSAGALAVLLSIAGRAVIGNLIAGLQIALAQPFLIGDTVYVEGQWGKIEDISYVDVVVLTWDQRRLIFPVSYFISNWFENWSKTDPYLVRASYLKVDFSTDVEAIRAKFVELVREDEDWAEDKNEPEVLVTEYGDETMTLRLTCGGADSSRAWSLACRVREQLMRWLQQAEEGAYLPRRRVLLDERALAAAAAPREEGLSH